MKMLFGFLIALILFVSGCTKLGAPEPPPGPPIETFEEQLKNFKDLGWCTQSPIYERITCKNVDVISKFKCESYGDYTLAVKKEGKKLGLVLVECSMHRNNLTGQHDYFYCMSSDEIQDFCISYITVDAGQLIQIKNASDLAKRIAPIENEQKALNYVAITNGKSVKLETIEEDVKKFYGKAEKTGNNFFVTLYAPDKDSGCYNTINYEAIQYKVTPVGEITEIRRDIVYTEKLRGTICH